MGPKRKNKTLEQVSQHIRRHPWGTCFMVILLASGAYVLMSESRSPDQMRAMDGMEATVAKFAEVSGGLRNVLRKQWAFSSDNRTKATALWTSMNQFQREQEVLEVLEKLRTGPFQKAAADLGTTDMVRMFHVACPDVMGKEFSESPAKLWNLLDSWFKGSSQEGLSAEARQSLEEVIKHGFWSGIEKMGFGDDDIHKFSATGWNAIRDVVLGIFLKGLGPDLVMKQERIARGEAGVLPEAPVPWSAEPEAQAVVHLSDASFLGTVGAKKYFLIMFYAPWCGHCKAFKPHLIQAASALQGSEDIGIGAVDCTTESEMARLYNVTAYPTISLFVDGERTTEFEGDRSAYGIIKFLNKIIGSLGDLEASLKPVEEVPWSAEPGDVVHMTDQSFDADITKQQHALVMFYAPWCGHCKAFKPAFSEVATRLKGKAVVAAMDATEWKVVPAKFEVKGFPTVLFFRDGKMVEAYQGPRDTASVVSWMAAHMGKSDL